MSSSDFDRIIAQEKKVLVSIEEHGDKFMHEFKRITALYVREWSIKLMKGYYAYKPEVPRTLGPAKLGEMKREFQGILEALPDQTNQRLDDSQIWLHRALIPDDALSDMTYSYQLEKRSFKYMDRALRDLIEPVGSLLIKYGFIDVDEEYKWEMTLGGTAQYVDDLPSKGMDQHKPLKKLMDQYKDILVEYVYAIQNLKKAQQAKRSAE